jgi:hypothetical protein
MSDGDVTVLSVNDLKFEIHRIVGEHLLNLLWRYSMCGNVIFVRSIPIKVHKSSTQISMGPQRSSARCGRTATLVSTRLQTQLQWGRDYNDVKELGALVNSTRTTEQTDIAHFWNANYLVVWNQALRDIAASEVSGIGRTARLFALANMAMTDAVISAWNAKTTYLFWRPVTAIQEGDRDGNSRTAGNPTWATADPNTAVP